MPSLARLAAASYLALAASLATAQTWPNRPIRVIVPAAPGGTVDLVSRALAQRLGDGLGQPVIVENKPGASTNLGNDFVAKSPPDGYTLLMSGITLSTNGHLYSKLTYDPINDFAPITLVATSANVLVVNPSLPAKTVRELVDLARAKPGGYFYGTPAVGATGHLAAEMFASLAGIKLTQVPYKGAAPALADLIAGQIHMTFDNVPAAIGFIRAGKLRAIAVTSAARSPFLPDVPTIAESGLPGYDISAWFGLVAPVKTPREIVAKLHAESVKALAAADVRERFQQLGFEAGGNTPEQFRALIVAESTRLGRVIRESGMKPE
jgi:tripartite-type tricarboxylate transporter receptor subunit TctC